MRTDDLDSDALDPLKRLAPRDEGAEHQVAERPVLEEERAHRLALDVDEAERLGDKRRDENRLSREEVELAEEARGPVAHDLVARGVDYRDLPLEDGNERIARVADPVQDVADVRRALLADPGK